VRYALPAGNPMRVVLLSVLIFEVIVFGLAVPVMILVSGVPPVAAALGGGGAPVCCASRSATWSAGSPSRSASCSDC
jgi:hypothetical protein